MAFQTEIIPLGPTASFRDWFNQYNNDVLSKLNLAQVAFPNAGDGITFSSSSGGGYTFALSGTVAKEMTFQNSVVFQGGVSLGNVELSGLVYGVSGDYTTAGVTLGKVVRLTNTGGLTLAQADSPQNAEVVGIAISVSTARTLVALAGSISGSSIANNLISGGFTSGCVYFLDPINAGGVTRAEPTSFGQVSKPMILGVGTNEGIILPYRGQYINGICGGSGDNIFNSAVFIKVESKGESGNVFGLRPGRIVAINTGTDPSGTILYNSVGSSNSYYKATNTTKPEAIIGIATEYVGSYTETSGNPVTIKVNTIGSVINDIANFDSDWAKISTSPIVYLTGAGEVIDSSGAQEPKLIVGSIADGNFIVNPISPSQTVTSFVGGGGGKGAGSSNILINGSLSLWQRARGVTLEYGITAGSTGNKQYLADKWVMWGTSGEGGFVAQRQTFNPTQIEVPGYPNYYVRLRKNTTPSTGYAYFYNVVDDVRTIANKQLTFSFYARTLGGTGTFAIHSIQNIASGSGTTYTNGTTHSTHTTIDSAWNRYSTTFVGPSATTGITGSYSLVGVRLHNNGATYEFAQFILEQGSTASIPQKVDINAEYARMMPYLQRSYPPDQLTGTNTENTDSAVALNLLPPYFRGRYSYQIKPVKVPEVKIYSLNGIENTVSIFSNVGFVNVLNAPSASIATSSPCSRSPLPSAFPIESFITVNPTISDFSFLFNWLPLVCAFDEIAFHYVADAETTIN